MKHSVPPTLRSVGILSPLFLLACSSSGGDPNDRADAEVGDEPSCFDELQNQGEERVDCGGPCGVCGSFQERMTADIDGVPFAANLVAGSVGEGLISFQSDQSQERQLFFEVPESVAPGIYSVGTANHSLRFAELFSAEFRTVTFEIQILRNDQERAELEGIFSATLEEFEFGEVLRTVSIQNGDFGVEYRPPNL